MFRNEIRLNSILERAVQKASEYSAMAFEELKSVNTRMYAGFVKINTDGSAIRNPGQAGAGTVVGDHYGNWITGSYGYIPLNYGCCGMALTWHLTKICRKLRLRLMHLLSLVLF